MDNILEILNLAGVFAIAIKKPVVPPYSPPEGDSVDFNFSGSYTAPEGDEADFNFS